MADSQRDVLVALLPQPRDLLLAQERGWYRVRSRELAGRIKGGLRQFTDLAFYQPDSFGPERRCVRYYAPIRGLSHARRIELLPEEIAHPRAQQLYLRIDLGPLESLPQPIPSARGRRILFIPTSWERVAAAEDINDLFIGSPIEDQLYRQLRAAGLLPEREYHVQVSGHSQRRARHYFLDFAIFCRQRNLDIETDGDTWHARRETIRADNERDNLLQASLWHVMRFNTAQLQDRLDTTVGVVREAVNKYGGVVQPDLIIRRFGPEGRLGPGQTTLEFPD
ncbi:MAG: DUF559 domain-containing protein [Armatimonadetes bacterium]|nr:DUF559 domain-containing protein [Armatimonadota bacterium]